MTILEALHQFDPTAASWMAEAACRGTDPNLFFCERGESTVAARAICATCPVTVPCLTYALRYRIRFGVWGGMSERARKRIRRDRSPYVRAKKDPASIPHGTLPRYRRGCRCDGCRRANTTQTAHPR